MREHRLPAQRVAETGHLTQVEGVNSRPIKEEEGGKLLVQVRVSKQMYLILIMWTANMRM
jgi:hypothetical protein